MTNKKKSTRKTKPARRNAPSRRSKPTRKTKSVRSTKRSRPPQVARTRRRSPLDSSLDAPIVRRHGLGARSAGQSGDTQNLSNAVDVDSESVEELIEEGQSFEAGVVAGVEDADSRQGEVRSKQAKEDDVPLEYLEKD